jgi:Tol biopolymer transport system component
LAGTENADLLFWSPDSRYLGFFADGKLKKIAASGGPTTVLSDAYASTYASWGHDGTILAGGVHPGIARFSELGGQVTALTNPDSTRQEVLHAAPKFLPDGRHFLFHAITSVPQQGTVLYVGSLDSKSTTRVMSLDSVSRYVAPGYLLFLRNRNLMAQLFDTNRQAPIGEPFALAENVAQNSFSASENGVLVYRTASTEPVRRATNELLWFDRKGNPKGQAGSPSNYARPMLSRDGRRVAVDTSDSGNRDIWVIDLNRTVDPSSRLTFNPDSDTNPVWAPDGSRIVFASNRGASLGQNLYQKSASGVGTDDLLLGGKADELAIPQDWSSDGQYIVFLRTTRVTLGTVDIWALPVRGDKKPFPLLESSSRKVQPQLSPDGRWLAYSTNESGTHQVVVQPFPDVNKGKWQVTTKGGIEPRWRRDGRELFYLGLDGKLMAVATKGSGGFEAGPPMSLFQTTLNAPINPTDFRYDVAADGQRFLINSPIASPSTEINSPPITVVINWTATLKK